MPKTWNDRNINEDGYTRSPLHLGALVSVCMKTKDQLISRQNISFALLALGEGIWAMVARAAECPVQNSL